MDPGGRDGDDRDGRTSVQNPTTPTSAPRTDRSQRSPQPINPFDTPYERIHRSSASIADPNSPEPTFGYAGPAWHGGGGTTNAQQEPNRLRRVLPDKWWKALCAWGADLDGGHDNQEDGGQGGRTNPFE